MSENENNKSVVTSYRLKEDTRDKLKKQLNDLGMSQQEYFNKVVTLMEMENVKQNELFAVNTTELQDITSRIYNMFIGLCDQGNSFLSNKDVELEELKVKYKDMLSSKEERITILSDELQGVYENLEVLQVENNNNSSELINIHLDYSKQLEQLEQSIKDKASLIEEYKYKNDMLLGDLSECKQYKVDIEEHKKLLAEVQGRENDLRDSLSDKDNTINQLNNTVDRLNEDNIKALEQIKRELSMNKQGEILELKQDHQTMVQELNSKHNNEVSTYQDKYKSVLEELEQLRVELHEKETKKTKKVNKKDVE